MSKHIDDGMQASTLHKKIARPVRCILLDSETLAPDGVSKVGCRVPPLGFAGRKTLTRVSRLRTQDTLMGSGQGAAGATRRTKSGSAYRARRLAGASATG